MTASVAGRLLLPEASPTAAEILFCENNCRQLIGNASVSFGPSFEGNADEGPDITDRKELCIPEPQSLQILLTVTGAA